uniref:Putative secreted protein n=1 Tax=Panstrongylus lignarius TaxID=156445 RepID=A0A224XUS8_9HEMI
MHQITVVGILCWEWEGHHRLSLLFLSVWGLGPSTGVPLGVACDTLAWRVAVGFTTEQRSLAQRSTANR